MTVIEVLSCVFAMALADVRWLRVAQREHYLPGAVDRFAIRWWYGTRPNLVLWLVALIGLMLVPVIHEASLLVALVIAVGPIGLSLVGRTAPVVWTRRLKTVAVVVVVFQLAIVGVAVLLGLGPLVAAVVAALATTAIEVALALTAPWERRLAQQFVDQAKTRLTSIKPKVVAITGSYGKTSTKNYVAHLLSSSKSSMTAYATPASFNNRAGLCRAINEQLTPGTDVFVAEMGTYGFGEIKELCEIVPPDIAVLTAIGPVHLERFGSEAAIVSAKSEIFERAPIAVLNVDDDRLAQVAVKLESEQGKKVWRCGSVAEQAVVRAVVEGDRLVVRIEGRVIAELEGIEAAPTNVACAVAVALELGIGEEQIAEALANLPTPAHRQQISRNEQGVTVIDDTYNANPASVRRGLELLHRVSTDDKPRVVVTPGMVELGRRQRHENEQFALLAGEVATDLVVVGRTNRKALIAGARQTSVNVVRVDTLPQAVAWVREHVGEDGAVLYANDLPDHFP